MAERAVFRSAALVGVGVTTARFSLVSEVLQIDGSLHDIRDRVSSGAKTRQRLSTLRRRSGRHVVVKIESRRMGVPAAYCPSPSGTSSSLPIWQTVSAKLRELLSAERDPHNSTKWEERAFYEIECTCGASSVRELKRQIGSLYSERSEVPAGQMNFWPDYWKAYEIANPGFGG